MMICPSEGLASRVMREHDQLVIRKWCASEKERTKMTNTPEGLAVAMRTHGKQRVNQNGPH
ncbi:hypothetical protein L195_g008024 [Trifolium pratense]|uniref:Uncharacterized protein n=1 Tax=Trifolium pratense TaxID=57577 RepID=A0A2K3P813_TRIPR|nr:hypothetical protein L195_g008024 [Trifolium pratense]